MNIKKRKKTVNSPYDKVSIERKTADWLRDYCRREHLFLQAVNTEAVIEYLKKNDSLYKSKGG